MRRPIAALAGALALLSLSLMLPLAGSASAGSHADPLAEITRFLQAAPPVPGEHSVGAASSQEGHWTFTNRSGDRLTAAGPVEVRRVLALLTGTAGGALLPRMTLVMPPLALVRGEGALRDLPGDAAWRVFVDGALLPVVKGPAERSPTTGARIEVRPRIVVPLTEEAPLIEAVSQLQRPIRQGSIRIVALEAGAAQAFASRGRADLRAPDAIDPAALATALAGVRGQTVVVSGRVEGDRLIAASSSTLGADTSLDLPTLRAAAAGADVDLIVLKTANARQPGSRNSLWLKVEVQGLATALDRPTLADFLAQLVSSGELSVRARALDRDRTRLDATVLPGLGVSRSVDTAIATAVTEVTGQLSITGVDGVLGSRARQRELAWRLVPGVDAIWQLTYAGLVVVGLAGLPIAWRWFGRLWPAEDRSDFGGRSGYWAAALVRTVVFVVAALPLLAIPALVARLVRLIGLGRPLAPDTTPP